MTTLKDKMLLDQDRRFDTDEHAVSITYTPKGAAARTIPAIVDAFDTEIVDTSIRADRRVRIRADNETTGVVNAAAGATVIIDGRNGIVEHVQKTPEGLEWIVDCVMGATQ